MLTLTLLSTEAQVDIRKEQYLKLKNQTFSEILTKEAIAVNPNVNIESIQSVIEESGLNWYMIEDQSRASVLKILQNIDDIDEDQSNVLYERMDALAPIHLDIFVNEIKRNVYDQWILKRMFP